MKDILTGLAIILLLCLTGALVAPHFISWANHREQVSAYLTDAVGQPVEVRGKIGIVLFPTPSLNLGQVVLTGEGGLSGDIGRLRLIGSIPPLLRGELKIVSANLDNARLIVRPDQLASASNSASNPLGAISIEKMKITQSSITLLSLDGTSSQLGKDINGELEASSLIGPFRGGLSYKQDEQIRTLRFSSGRIENNQLRVKSLLENESAAARTEFDGQLVFADGQISGEGSVTASGNATLPMASLSADTPVPQVIWRLTTKAKSSRGIFSFDDIELSLGQDDRQAVFSGNGSLNLNLHEQGKFSFVTRQIDIDRLLGDENKQLPRTPETLIQLVAANAGQSITIPWLSGEVDVSAGSIILNRSVIIAPKVVVSVKNGVSAIKHVSAELPGQSMILVQASTDPVQDNNIAKPSQVFAGDMSLDSKDFTKLSSWFHGVSLRASPVKALRLTGKLFQTSDSIGLSQAAISSDGLNMTGDVNLRLSAPRMKLDLKLSAEQIDIARLPTFADIDGPGILDFNIQLDANRVQFSGVGAGSIHVKARREESSLFLDAFSIKDIGGASLNATGSVGKIGSKLVGELDANKLDGLVQLVSRVTSHPALSVLATRANALVPARVSFSLTPDSDNVRIPTAKVEFKGRLKDTEIAGYLRLNEVGDLLPGEAIELTVSSQSTASALQQLGIETIKLDHAGPLSLRLSAHGFVQNAVEAPWSLKGEMAQVSIDLKAKRTTDFAQPISGFITMNSRDISPLAQTMLIAVPAVAPGQSLDLKADFDLRGFKITLRELEAKSGQGFVRGELAFNLAEFGRIAGQLQTSELDILSLSPLIAGSINSETSTGRWSAKPFGRVAPVTLPGDVWISAESVRLGEGLRLDNPRFVLRFENGLIYIEYAETEALGAKLKGAATFRRMDKSVSVTGKFGVVDGSLGRGSSQAALNGKFDGDIEFSAFADSPANLVASLSGAGRAKLSEVQLNGVKQGVLAEAVQSSLSTFDPALYDSLSNKLKSEFNGKISLPPFQIPLVLSGGVLRAGPYPLLTQQEELSSTLAIDLKSLNLLNETIIRLREAPKNWEGTAPSASVIWKGPIAQPQMSIEATALANGLTALAITRESERIDSLEQDQRERSIFNRRLQASQDEQKRIELERSKLLQLRRELEAKRRAEELLKQRPVIPPTFSPTTNAPNTIPRASALPPPLLITPPAAR